MSNEAVCRTAPATPGLLITFANKVLHVITGYGLQENWDHNSRSPFNMTLEEEIAAAELEGRAVLMDANA